MSARLLVMLYLLEEAKKSDNLEMRRQARRLRNFGGISRDIDFIRRYRLSGELINKLEDDLRPYLPVHRRSGGLTNRLKVINFANNRSRSLCALVCDNNRR